VYQLKLKYYVLIIAIFYLNILNADESNHLSIDRSRIEKIKAEQYTKKLAIPINQRILETSTLPLKLTFQELAEKVNFPAEGGSLGLINDQLAIMDRFGQLYIYDKGKLKKINFFNFPSHLNEYILYSKAQNLTGSAFRAHSFVYDKKYSIIYVAYTAYVDNENNHFEVASIKIDPKKLVQISNPEIFFKTESVGYSPSSLSGGGKLLLNNYKLYFSVGYSNDNAQDLSSSFGKVFEYDPKNKTVTLFSYGHRNIQGMALAKNNIYSVEHGPQGGDEINKLEKNSNYGWPYKSYGTKYGEYKIVEKKSGLDNYVEPFYAFVPSIGPSSIIHIKNFDTSWDGDFLVSSLKAQSIYRLKVKNNRVIFCEPIWIGHRVRDLIQIKNSFFALTDDSLLIKIEIDENILNKNSKSSGLAEKLIALKKCLNCHHFEQTNPTHEAPSLAFINGKKIASDNYYKYSDGLKKKNGFWTDANLSQFLKNPQKFSPGTTMPNLNLSEKEIHNIIVQISNLGS
jgi:cytochrome c2